jgi:uncharacterized membrane protein
VDLTPRRGETRWAAGAAVVAVAGAQYLLLGSYVPGPRWLLPAVEVLLLAALLGADPGRLTRESKDLRVLALALVAVVALANGATLVLLLRTLINGGFQQAGPLLRVAGGVWLVNTVAFGLLYWELDRGGPLGRVGARPASSYADLQFPQDDDPSIAPPDWRPTFADYLYVSVTTSTAFSPTDTMPLTRRAKLLMGLQSVVSLLTLALVAARAVNVIR